MAAKVEAKSSGGGDLIGKLLAFIVSICVLVLVILALVAVVAVAGGYATEPELEAISWGIGLMAIRTILQVIVGPAGLVLLGIAGICVAAHKRIAALEVAISAVLCLGASGLWGYGGWDKLTGFLTLIANGHLLAHLSHP